MMLLRDYRANVYTCSDVSFASDSGTSYLYCPELNEELHRLRFFQGLLIVLVLLIVVCQSFKCGVGYSKLCSFFSKKISTVAKPEAYVAIV
jgi:hypothetical protein